MDKFEEMFKEKLENYEIPYEQGSWLKIKNKLPTKSHKLLKYSIVAAVVIIIGLFNYNSSVMNTNEVINNITKIPVIYNQITEVTPTQRIKKSTKFFKDTVKENVINIDEITQTVTEDSQPIII